MYSPSFSRRTLGAVCTLLTLAVAGCDEASVTEPEIPGGGQALVLDYETFEVEVMGIFTARGCDNSACHGGGIRGTFALSPASDKDPGFDFDQASLQVSISAREASALLLKPLAESEGGMAHAGEGPNSTFASTDDPDFQTLRAWILDGEIQ